MADAPAAPLIRIEKELALDIKRYVDNEKTIADSRRILRECGAELEKLGSALTEGDLTEDGLGLLLEMAEKLGLQPIEVHLSVLSEAYARRDSLGANLESSGYLTVLEKLNAS